MNQATEVRIYMVTIDANEGRVTAQVTRTIEGESIGYDILPRTINGQPCDPDTEFLDGTIDMFTNAMDAECERLDALEDREAERVDMEAKAARLRELTRPAKPAPESLDDLIGAIREAAEHADWVAVHEYALDIASIAEGNMPK